nr:MAG TPA: hypothetical protein [Caudoviricetes sp.]
MFSSYIHLVVRLNHLDCFRYLWGCGFRCNYFNCFFYHTAKVVQIFLTTKLLVQFI